MYNGINIYQVIDMKLLKKVIPYLIIIMIVTGVVFVGADTEKNSAIHSVSKTLPVIIIDAGHGGIDGGAVAADGTTEKDINLYIALKMNAYLGNLGYETVLTRSDDESIHSEDAQTTRQKKVSDLHNRLEIIKSNPDSIFVSVHQNYYTQSKYSGAQVFFSENNPQSSVLAQCIQDSIVSSIQPDNTRKIKQNSTSIFLLSNSTVPSVMVECGFLSNVAETEKLKNEDYRMQMAEAICKGIINYINGKEIESAVND